MDANQAPVLVSACLLGVQCTYRGGDEARPALVEALESCTVVPVCPEVEGGLGTPRPRAEVEGGDGAAVLDGRARVCTDAGEDVTAAYLAGARAARDAARRHGVRLAVLKDASPSCGCRGIYDGSHTRTRRPEGVGVTAALLAREGIETVTETEAIERLRHG